MSHKFIVPKNDNTNSTFHLIISKGSILNFHHKNGAIVNAANKGCLGGGGVDGAISTAGGEKLFSDRKALPLIQDEDEEDDYGNRTETETVGLIRCHTGDAKMTGPNSYGSIGCKYVIHAVGPAYFSYPTIEEPDTLLRSAYQQSLERAREVKLEAVAFSLLSAGVFRGSRSRRNVLGIGVESICGFDYREYPELEEVHMFAFSPIELNMLLQVVDEMGLTQEL
jgi:O-acetyl-ADP-ribose deacetylase (regulator of RNase III)